MRLPVDPGPAAWNALLPEPASPDRLDSDTVADFLVIGAGFAGLAATVRLSQLAPSSRIVTLDATRVGHGPAGRNSGFMIDLPHDLSSSDYGGAAETDRATIEDNRRAIAFARDMVQRYGLPAEAFDLSGKVNAAATAKGDAHNCDYAAHLASLGETHEMLDARQMQEMTGTSYYSSGLYTPGTVMLQPAMFVRGVAAGVRSNRVTLHEISPVTALAPTGDGAWRATTPAGTVQAGRVILAVNGHLESFGYGRGRLVHTHTFASMTRALTPDECGRLGGRTKWHVTPADPLGTTVRRISGTGGDRIVVRNRFTYDPGLEPGRDWLAQIGRDHDRAFAARFPMLADVPMEFRWGGRLCLSLNNVQMIGELEPGLYSACVQNGLGTARGTLAGMLAAELACGEDSPALQRALAADAPRRLPPDFVATPAARARLRWGEWRAGREK